MTLPAIGEPWCQTCNGFGTTTIPNPELEQWPIVFWTPKIAWGWVAGNMTPQPKWIWKPCPTCHGSGVQPSAFALARERVREHAV